MQKGDSNSKHSSFSEFYFNVSNKISSTPHPLLNLLFWSFKLTDCDFSGRFSLVLEKALVKSKNSYPNGNFIGWIESQRHDSVIDQMGR